MRYKTCFWLEFSPEIDKFAIGESKKEKKRTKKETPGLDVYKTITFAEAENCQFMEVCVFSPFICMKAGE